MMRESDQIICVFSVGEAHAACGCQRFSFLTAVLPCLDVHLLAFVTLPSWMHPALVWWCFLCCVPHAVCTRSPCWLRCMFLVVPNAFRLVLSFALALLCIVVVSECLFFRVTKCMILVAVNVLDCDPLCVLSAATFYEHVLLLLCLSTLDASLLFLFCSTLSLFPHKVHLSFMLRHQPMYVCVCLQGAQRSRGEHRGEHTAEHTGRARLVRRREAQSQETQED